MKKTLRSASPNGHALALVEFVNTSFETPAEFESIYVVVGPTCDRDDDGDEFDTLAEAEAHFEAEKVRLAEVPNHAAQAAYDAEWGTDNGYAPFARRPEY